MSRPPLPPAERPAPQRPRAQVAARLLSIIGHPAVVMPLVVPMVAARRDAHWSTLLVIAALAVGIAAIVGFYSWLQVRAGRWADADASVPSERQHLNVFVASLLLVLAAALWAAGQPRSLVAGLAVAAGIVLAALALQRWLKVSLHCAFGAYAAALAWPVVPAAAALGALVLGVGWSRLRLGRHDTAEVVVGSCLGVAAGTVLHLAARAAAGA